MALKGESVSIQIDGAEIEQVHKFPYLGSVITDDAMSEADFKHRLALGAAVMAKLKPLWNSHALTLKSKITICRTLVWPLVAYGCESRTL